MLKLTQIFLTTGKELSPRGALVQSAYALAVAGAIPPVAESHPEVAYNNLVMPMVRQFANEVNEQSAIRVSELMDLTKQLWMQRYRAVYPNPHYPFVGLLLTKEQLPEIYLTELNEFIDSNTGQLRVEHSFIRAAMQDARGE